MKGVRMRRRAGGIAFMLVVSFGLGNFGRWLVRGGTKRSAGLNVISRDTPAVSYYPRSRRRRTTGRSSPSFFDSPVQPLRPESVLRLNCADYQCRRFVARATESRENHAPRTHGVITTSILFCSRELYRQIVEDDLQRNEADGEASQRSSLD